MTQYTNATNIPLSVAVWLATDNYDHPPDDGQKHISATGLMKSVRQIVLSQRLGKSASVDDISNRVASRFGTAVHDAIEKAWEDNQVEAMTALGYPKHVAERVRVNPTDPDEPDIIPVYMEQRFHKKIGDWNVSGQFDFVGDGRLEDFKSTGTFTWTNNTKDDDYIMQGSIYRWGRPDIITQDTMAIQFIFKDWQKHLANGANYPPAMLVEKTYRLKSVQETDLIIKKKLNDIDKHWNTPEPDLPECTPKELWQSSGSTWKYYKDPAKRNRSTKNFDNPHDANLRLVKDGGKGLVVEVKPEPTACRYCAAFPICSQKDRYLDSGELKI